MICNSGFSIFRVILVLLLKVTGPGAGQFSSAEACFLLGKSLPFHVDIQVTGFLKKRALLTVAPTRGQISVSDAFFRRCRK